MFSRHGRRPLVKGAAMLSLGALLALGSRLVAADTASAPAAPSSPSAPSSPAAPSSSASSGTAPAASTAPSGAGAEAAKKRFAVAAIGDSLTDAKSHGGKFLDYLRERCPGSQFDNYGKGGQMVNQMRKRFAADVLGEPAVPGSPKPSYTHVIVFGGVNDIYSDLTAKRTPKLIQRDLLWMYEAAKAKGAEVIAITVAPWGGFTSYYNGTRGAATLKVNGWIRSQLAAGSVDHVIDAYPLLSCGNPERLCPTFSGPFKDGLHFNKAGHEKLGKALHEQVFSSCL
jgi:lysophospholipase L1-like esterase